MSNLFRLSKFGFLAVTGRDAHKFMQGYTTCDVNKLSVDRHLGAICNLQGKTLTNFRITDIPDGLLLRMHRDRILPTTEFLSKYIVFSKASLTDVSDEWHCYGLIGQAPAPTGGDVHLGLGEDRTEIWSRTPLPDASEDTLAWDKRECLAGLAWICAATAEQFLPQMIGLNAGRGIDFDKGCYLGQEIVARSQYRGALKRHLYRGTVSNAPPPGSVLMGIDRKSVGTIVAVAGTAILAVVSARVRDSGDDDTVTIRMADGETASLSPATVITTSAP